MSEPSKEAWEALVAYAYQDSKDGARVVQQITTHYLEMRADRDRLSALVEDAARATCEHDASNLRLYAHLFEEHKWQDPVIHWGVFYQTLNEIAGRIDELYARLTAPAEAQPQPDSAPVADTRKERIAALGGAVRRLADEASEFVDRADPLRHGIGNIQILRDRINSAREMLCKMESQ